MKIHIFLACLIGFLAVGYTLLAPIAPYQPDSVETIAHFQQQQLKTYNEASSRLIVPAKSSPIYKKRGVTALA